MRRSLVLPAAVALAVAPLFAGCAPTNDAAEQKIVDAIVAVSPAVDGALAGYGSSGSEVTLTLKMYIPTAASMTTDELASVVGDGLEAAWFASETQPFFVSLGVVPAAKPDGAKISDQDLGSFPELAAILGEDRGTASDAFGFMGSGLALRFGHP